VKHGVTSARFEVREAGIDTVSLAWKPKPDDEGWWAMVAGRLRAGWIDHAIGLPGLEERGLL